MMKICSHANICSVKECPHRKPHEHRNDCGPCDCFDKEVDCLTVSSVKNLNQDLYNLGFMFADESGRLFE